MLCFSPLRQCKMEYSRLLKQKYALLATDDNKSHPGDELDLLDSQIDELVEGRYAEEVFRHFQKKQPTLIRTHTGEEVSWRDAFGDSFESVSKSLRHSLVGLVEGGGRYRIK